MKNTIKKMIKAIAGVCAFAAVFAMSDNTGGTALAMSVVAGVAGGKHVINEPLTVALTNVESPDLLVNEIDRRLVKNPSNGNPHRPVVAMGRLQEVGQHGC